MLIRIVRMTFQENHIADFLAHFEENKAKIRHFEGCLHLEVWQDANLPTVFMTYSHWQSEEHLNNYRHSELFAGVWKATKQWFADKPQAFSSYQKIVVE